MIKQHESILSNYMNRPTLKDRLFSDFSGELKSLGLGVETLRWSSREIQKNKFENTLRLKALIFVSLQTSFLRTNS